MKKGDIVQITDETHSWFPSLIIVSDPKIWGIQGYVIIPKSNDGSVPVAIAFTRLETWRFQKVGDVIFTKI